jgi:hypothetical protein
VLAVADGLARDRSVAAQRPAELAHDPASAALIEMDLLAGQRCAPAVATAVAVGLELTDAAAQYEPLERRPLGHP